MASTSSNNNKHPYLTLSFWMEPLNQYWESDKYSEKQKEQYRQWLSEKINNEHSLVEFVQPFKSRV